MIATHRYLCRRGARKFARAGVERGDLEQVAAIGLIKAARRYDPGMRTPFEAYAWLTIVGELMHYVRDHERQIRIPRRLRALERRAVDAHDALLGRFEREPTEDELAAELAIAPALLRDMRRAYATTSFASLADAVDVAEHSPSGLSCEDRYLFSASFAALEETERRVIVGVYVFGFTKRELGRRLGMSAKRISRVHQHALGRMQRAWAS